MTSILSDFEHDIFISYRHNDNRSGWVTEFVNALQEELASTIKEPLTIYFDKNPHDGLLETHNVDKSLEGKLKCLIFIPIISQTYCDPKSFAWQHEFVAFNKFAKEGTPLSSGEGPGVRSFGRDIKLSNGNVASRILPLKIHDLDAEDKSLIENEIGGVLRAIEFIYKEAGVNRPLRSNEENPTKNQNQTVYRNQVNKVANAIKEIINALKNPIAQSSRTTTHEQPSTNPPKNRKVLIASLVLLCVIAISYFFYQQRTANDEQRTELDKSIAVLPFTDLSPTHDQEYFGDGMAEAIINGLGQVSNLKVIARSSSFQFKGKNESLLTIGEMLNVATALEGSVTKSGNRIRVRATLTKTKDGTQIWSETFDRNVDDYLLIQDEITSKIVGALRISFSGQLRPSQRLTNNNEAMKLYQRGRYFHDKNGDGDSKRAAAYFAQAVKADSNFAMAWAYLGTTSDEEVSKFDKYTQKALALDPNLADALLGAAGVAWSNFNFAKGESDIRKALSLDKENPRILRNTGRVLGYLGYYDEGLELCKKAVEIDPLQAWSYLALTQALSVKGNFVDALQAWQKENEISNRNGLSTKTHLLLLSGRPNDALPLVNKIQSEEDKLFLLAVISFSLNQKAKSEQYFQKFKSSYGASNPHALGELLCFFGRKKEALLMLESVKLKPILHWPPPDQWFRFWLLFRGSPYLIPLRDDSTFKEICKKLNYPDIQ